MTPLIRRRAMMKQGKPYDAEIEYLQSSGTQFIDTGIIQRKLDIEISLRIQWIGTDRNLFESFFAYMENNSTYPRCGIHKYNGKWMFGYNATSITNTSIDTNVHNIFYTSNSSTRRQRLYLDGIEIGNTGYTSILTTGSISFFMYARNRSNNYDNIATVRIMSCSCKVFEDADHSVITQEIDLIPVRVGQIGYMYDKVSGQLLGNQGTGSFILGNDL